ncbi:1-phosphatidylinositol-4,5-bisphosphate phosphodiesterase [Xylariaceae sp. FL0255]|nr:1-phosphatidylinositol-4,5-bisphosphate phosphodiesterase [Xylariaceae sp. FL0255]
MMTFAITAGLAKLGAVTSRRRYNENAGDKTDELTVAGGGHSARRSTVTTQQLRVSRALKSFLVDHGVLPEDAAALDSDGLSPDLEALLDKPHIQVPPELTDRSHPLSEYFISSSHNTYLLGNQLEGKSAASAYQTALTTGARCVEIDAWDNEEDKEEPKVTHGYTLVTHVPFRSVCETMRDVMDREATEARDQQGYRAAPIMVSLENHCSAYGQLRLVQIMEEVWGDRLLSKAVREKGHREQTGSDEQVTLEELGSKIVLIVEYFFPVEDGKDDGNESEASAADSSDDEDDEREQARLAYKEKKKAEKKSVIIPELAALGVYAQSVKPRDDSWFTGQLIDGPRNHLINISETGLKALLAANRKPIAQHNSQHLMRVFPKGTRISSQNLAQAPFWSVGAQICAMNWQTFGASTQLNEALFSGTEGYVLKPAALRGGGSGLLTGARKKLNLHIAGATDIPLPKGYDADGIKPYVTCTLVHPDNIENEHEKCKTEGYKQHKIGFLHRGENPPPTDPLYDQTLSWEYDDNELVFLRILIKDDVSFAENPIFAVTCIRLSYIVPGWSFVRLLDLHGHETTCTVLCKFEFEDS